MASPGIEPGSGASEALILSIVLRGLSYIFIKITSVLYPEKIGIILSIVLRGQKRFDSYKNYFPNWPILLPNILTAIASNITPKNFLITIIPLRPKNFSIHFKDLSTT